MVAALLVVAGVALSTLRPRAEEPSLPASVALSQAMIGQA